MPGKGAVYVLLYVIFSGVPSYFFLYDPSMGDCFHSYLFSFSNHFIYIGVLYVYYSCLNVYSIISNGY